MPGQRERVPLGLTLTKGRSTAAGSQALVNLYAEPVEREGRTVMQLLPWPGKVLFSTIGGGNVRGQIEVADDHYAVIGETLYVVDDTGAASSVGTIEGTEPVDLDSNGADLVIVAELKSYRVLLSTGVLTEITTDPDLSTPTSVTSVNGYSITTRSGSDVFQWSSLRDATAWDALDFATAESNADSLVAVRTVNKELVLIGKKTIEFWYNSGNPLQAFEPRSVAPLKIGGVARNASIVADGSLILPARDGEGGGLSIVRINGYQAEKVSTPAIDKWLWDNRTTISTARAFSFQLLGHAFYVLTIPGVVTLVLDLSTKTWLPYVRSGTYAQNTEPGGIWDAVTFATNGNNLIVGASDGNLYKLDDTVFTEAGSAIIREVILPQLHKGGLGFTVHRLEADIEPGVGLTSGQGSNPVMMFNKSVDGGKTWDSARECGMGVLGDYIRRVFWSMCGYGRNFIARLRVSDPVKTVWLGIYAEIETHRT
jgi:hypothetical protein